jgi:flagella basal body P-ring formation protein FlgA
MIRIPIVAAALLIAFAGNARTETPAPRLKELVTVTSELVRIGDLAEHAGAAANTAVFRAPDLGQTGSVPVARIADALRQHGVTDIDAGGITEVVVTRLSRAITGDELKERIARAFGGQFGFGNAKNLAVILDRDVRALHVEAGANSELALTRMNADARTGRFDVAFELPGSTVARRLPLRFTGTITETVPTATLVRALRAGETLKASDVSVERRPKTEVGLDAMTAEQAVGLAAKHVLRAGQTLRPGDLVKAQVVQRNEVITLIYQVPGVSLTVRGKATEAGAVGDIINVLNVQSNRSVQGTVTGPGRVTIAGMTPVVAAAPSEETSSKTE